MAEGIEESDLLRFVEGDCSPDEAAAIQAWIAADPRRGELLDEIRAVWRFTGSTTRPWVVAEARLRLLHGRGRHAAQRSAGFSARPRPLRRAGPRLGMVRIAAAIACVVAGTLVWRLRPQVASFREYTTQPGQRLQLELPDSSRVRHQLRRACVPGGRLPPSRGSGRPGGPAGRGGGGRLGAQLTVARARRARRARRAARDGGRLARRLPRVDPRHSRVPRCAAGRGRDTARALVRRGYRGERRDRSRRPAHHFVRHPLRRRSSRDARPGGRRPLDSVREDGATHPLGSATVIGGDPPCDF